MNNSQRVIVVFVLGYNLQANAMIGELHGLISRLFGLGEGGRVVFSWYDNLSRNSL